MKVKVYKNWNPFAEAMEPNGKLCDDTRERGKVEGRAEGSSFTTFILTSWFPEVPRSMFATLSKGRWRETAQSGHEEGH